VPHCAHSVLARRTAYRTISSAQYRESLNAFFGAGNDGTIDCIVGNLPAG
jgi:hypothetical protein